jgi:predicted transcriptional regulator
MDERKLPDAELEVLACLWQRGGEATAREVREALHPYRPMTHGSVMNLLKRLEEKQLVRKRKGNQGKAFIFKAAEKPGPTLRRLIRNLLDRVFGGSGPALVASLFEARPPTAAEIDDLQGLLDALKAREEDAP